MRDALAPIARRSSATIVEVDVDADAALEARFGDYVPVLLLGGIDAGRELCHYWLDAKRVTEALAAPQ